MKYCEFCGKQLNDNENCTCNEAVAKATKTNKVLKLGLTIGVVALILFAIIAGIIGTLKTDPSAYLGEPVFSGFNTMGTASVSFDKDALIKGIIGEEPDTLGEEYLAWYEEYDAYAAGIECVYPKEGLSNGDSFNVSVHVTGKVADKIKSIEKTYTVTGLKEVETIDVFQHIHVEFSGISGEANATVKKTSEDAFVQACQLQIDTAQDLKNGDVVTVTVSNTESLLQQFNAAPAETSKTYTVSGLGAYATVEDLSMDEIQKIAAHYVAEKQAENDAEGVMSFTYSDVTIYGIYFMEGKEDAWGAKHNELHILICYDFFIGGEYNSTNYIPFAFRDIVVDPDGSVELTYEDGSETGLFYTDIESYISKMEEKYVVTKIEK